MSTNKVDKSSISDKRSTTSALRLKQARKEKGFSQDDIAEYLGKKDRSSISYIENNKQNPSIEELLKLAIKYEKDPAWLAAIDVMIEETDVNLDHPDVSSVNEELNLIEYQVNEISKRRLPQGANLQALKSSVELIQSFLKSFEESSDE